MWSQGVFLWEKFVMGLNLEIWGRLQGSMALFWVERYLETGQFHNWGSYLWGLRNGV